MTKRATQNLIAQRRVPIVALGASLIAGLVSGCSSSDYLVGSSAASAPVTRSAIAEPAAVPQVPGGAPTTALMHTPAGANAGLANATGQDGYPNINVDTARRLGTPVRTAADQDKLEAELLALGARQRAGADASAPASVIGELKDLGRRSKTDAEKVIESGAVPE